MTAALAGLAGMLTGVLSSWGVGGGTLLIIYMTALAGFSQQMAQGINLIYFIPTSLTALISHIKNGLVEKSAAIPAVLGGIPVTLITSFVAAGADVGVIKKIFGVFLIVTGVAEFIRRDRGRGAE